jgi:2-polyprenyl-3-methyl-5-hydroxy-6-metoxy-1,4-benzoquinol methylase
MHAEAYEYIASQAWRGLGVRVLEIGSLDINGSLRPLFRDALSYTGIDIVLGRGVDMVSDGATHRGHYDLILCAEVFEHCAYWQNIIRNSYAMLNPGGSLIATAAGPERAPHGRMGGNVGSEHYAPVNHDALCLALWASGYVREDVRYGRGEQDIYATAERP